jgi:hypothetical protein
MPDPADGRLVAAPTRTEAALTWWWDHREQMFWAAFTLVLVLTFNGL